MTFACLSALEPRVTKIVVASITTILKPRAAASTTTAYAGFLYGAALGAYGADCFRDGRRRGCYS